ncbi:hypothetical protein SAY87_020624 [Trapa incisa]|uniref:EDR1/CTR1/ARMC3-like peptidase-like domain-containing protein n=1 Tax=Trapa incisa TaxID=236973 RepID=A0AAN7JR41_9MYRT|nr:hypothetical protein SAY87_020624 [Trapa incisa]
MPHRTTYFFPRQFPDHHHPGFESPDPKQQLSEHEKKISTASSATSPTTRGRGIRAPKVTAFNTENSRQSFSKTAKDGIFTELAPISDLFTGEAIPFTSDFTVKHQTKKQLTAFRYWFAEQKGAKEKSSPLLHVKPSLSSTSDGDHELLLSQSEPEPERVFGRHVSLPRVSSGSSYAGSLFAGATTIVDDSFSIGVNDSWLLTLASAKRGEEEKKEEVKKVSLAQQTREGYLLQLSLAKRLASEASLSIELQPHSQRDGAVEAVSHRLWVSGCLSYADKISDGFYNILGMSPSLWVMCNDLEEGKKPPSLIALRNVEPSETSMEVVLVDKREDSSLKDLEDKAQALQYDSENALVLVKKLGKVVAISMGGTFPLEQGNLYRQWRVISKRLKDILKCIVLPIGSISSGLCRHRAILFKIKDDRHLSREYVVDLVGEPGNVHCPDSSINGCFISLIPSPFQVSNLKAFQRPYMDHATSYGTSRIEKPLPLPDNYPYSSNWRGDELNEVSTVGELSATQIDLHGNIHFVLRYPESKSLI